MKDKALYALNLAVWAITIGLLAYGAVGLIQTMTKGTP